MAVDVDPENAEIDDEYEDYEDDEQYLEADEDRRVGGRYVAIAE